MKDICIKNFQMQVEAEIAKSMLEANGIKSVIQKQGFALGGEIPAAGSIGVDLFVLEKDFEKAKELLDIK